jgi:hypothetical protein
VIRTPYVCVVQHDLPFAVANTINFTAITLDMANPKSNLNFVSFNLLHDNDPTIECDVKGFNCTRPDAVRTLRSTHGSHSYMTTHKWTDNNHICRTNYLEALVHACSFKFPEILSRNGA